MDDRLRRLVDGTGGPYPPNTTPSPPIPSLPSAIPDGARARFAAAAAQVEEARLLADGSMSEMEERQSRIILSALRRLGGAPRTAEPHPWWHSGAPPPRDR